MGCRDVLALSFFCVAFAGAAVAVAENDAGTVTPHAVRSVDIHEPANGGEGLSQKLAGGGVEVALGSTNIYQANVRGGLDTHRRSGRLSGSYDLELATDLEQLFGVAGLGLFIHGQGGWPDTEGIDAAMVGSAFGVNTDAGGNRALDVVEVVLEWQLFDGGLTLLAGKMDLAGVFDTSAYANDETSQFLNGALVNNPTIPLPDYCLGVILTANLTDAWYVSAGMGDAEADGRTTDFRTAFHGPDYFFYALETGMRVALETPHGPLPGNYRCGLWYDPRPKTHSDGDRLYRDDVGVYASFDQTLLKENEDPEDSQGLGVFCRCGYANERRNDLSSFWSVGLQYQGLLEGREDDVLALGFALGAFSDQASESFTADHESVLELYYSAQVASRAAISPSIQYVARPGGTTDVKDAAVVGVRAQINF